MEEGGRVFAFSLHLGEGWARQASLPFPCARACSSSNMCVCVFVVSVFLLRAMPTTFRYGTILFGSAVLCV